MNKSIPHNIEAEQAVLGSLIDDNALINEVSNILTTETFFKPSHQHIYRAITELNITGDPVDEVTIGDNLRKNGQLDESGGYGYIAELIECSPSSGNITYYSKIIQEYYILRNLIQAADDIQRKAKDPEISISEILTEAQDIILKTAASKTKQTTFLLKDILTNSFAELERRSEAKEEIIGIPTGFIDLDRIISGLVDESLTIIGARPGMGKTALALNIVSNTHASGKIKGCSLIFTKEMSKEKLAMRMMSSHGNINNKNLKTGILDHNEWDKLSMATDTLSPYRIFIDKGTRTITEIRHKAIILNRDEPDGVGLIVVDYIQLFSGSKKNMPREQEIAEISRELKALAEEMCCPVVALSQLNRKVDERKDKRPQLSDLRESGSLEQDADIILFIYRDEVYYEEKSKFPGIAEILISKNREGGTGSIDLGFIGKYTKFTNLSRQ